VKVTGLRVFVPKKLAFLCSYPFRYPKRVPSAVPHLPASGIITRNPNSIPRQAQTVSEKACSWTQSIRDLIVHLFQYWCFENNRREWRENVTSAFLFVVSVTTLESVDWMVLIYFFILFCLLLFEKSWMVLKYLLSF
jgi:hypothetical protein